MNNNIDENQLSLTNFVYLITQSYKSSDLYKRNIAMNLNHHEIYLNPDILYYDKGVRYINLSTK